jgi:putative endonuclease
MLPISQQLGRRAEDVAAAHLTSAGYTVLERNLRVGRLELDLVVRADRLVVVVEVRTRGKFSWVRALDSVDVGKRQRVREAGARLWRERFASNATVDRMRFDIVSVEFLSDGGTRVEVVEGAF